MSAESPLTAGLMQRLTWGPFTTEFHKTFADDRLRQALREWIDRELAPRMPFGVPGVQGRFLPGCHPVFDDEWARSWFHLKLRVCDAEKGLDLCLMFKADLHTKQLTQLQGTHVCFRAWTRAELVKHIASERGRLTVCPGCGYRTVARHFRSPSCRICQWHNDGFDDEMDGISVSEAREHVRRHGCIFPPSHPSFAIEPELLAHLEAIKSIEREWRQYRDGVRELLLLKEVAYGPDCLAGPSDDANAGHLGPEGVRAIAFATDDVDDAGDASLESVRPDSGSWLDDDAMLTVARVNARAATCALCEARFHIRWPGRDERDHLARMSGHSRVELIDALCTRGGCAVADATAIAGHMTTAVGECHHCGQELPGRPVVDCPRCRSLNIQFARRQERAACPACGFEMFSEGYGSFSICNVCDWEDCGVQLANPTSGGGPNRESLLEYQTEILRRIPLGITMYRGCLRDPRWRPLNAEEIADFKAKEAIDSYYHPRIGSSGDVYWLKTS